MIKSSKTIIDENYDQLVLTDSKLEIFHILFIFNICLLYVYYIKMSKSNKFDLKNIKLKFTSNVKKNINILEKKYGKKFIIKLDNLEVNVILEKKKLDSNNMEFYIIRYDEPDRKDELYPFKISFYDPILHKINSNSYIANIRKTDKISGSSMINLVLEINRVLYVKKTYLWDSSTITCAINDIDLGLIKILEKGHTFYMNFGFKPDVANPAYDLLLFNNNDQLDSKLELLLSKVKKITIKSIIQKYNKLIDILTSVIKSQDFNSLKIINIDTYTYNPISSNQTIVMKDPKKKLTHLFEECSKVFNILLKTEEKYLVNYIVWLFKNNCSDCVILLDYFCYNYNYKIIWNKKIIKRDYLIYFHYINSIRKYFYYSYTFTS